MTRHDPEIEELREKVHCAVVLERTPPPWKLDRKESTKLSLKYRRAKGEILIVSHAGRGWWDPTSDAKGDVFRLVLMASRQSQFGLRCGIRTQLVSHQNVGREAVLFEQLAHQFHRRRLVASPLHQQIENLAFVVDRSPEPESLAGDQNCHLVPDASARWADDVCGEVPWRTTARTSTPIV
jgi:hypothetical protein